MFMHLPSCLPRGGGIATDFPFRIHKRMPGKRVADGRRHGVWIRRYFRRKTERPAVEQAPISGANESKRKNFPRPRAEARTLRMDVIFSLPWCISRRTQRPLSIRHIYNVTWNFYKFLCLSGQERCGYMGPVRGKTSTETFGRGSLLIRLASGRCSGVEFPH
jgi:hypothetical protein